MSATLAVIDAKNHPSYTEAEMRARSILSRMDSLTAKLKTLEDDIRALWLDFDNLKPGETILGCATKKEFCEKKLHRTPRAVRYMLGGGNANNHDREEIISPPVLEPALMGQPERSKPKKEPLDYDKLLASISQRILTRDHADEPYTQEVDEPLGWRTRNTVRVRITTIIHNMTDRRVFWFDLSRLLWASGWQGNTVFRENRREAWIFHWTDPTKTGRPQEMPDDWGPETDLDPRPTPNECAVEIEKQAQTDFLRERISKIWAAFKLAPSKEVLGSGMYDISYFNLTPEQVEAAAKAIAGRLPSEPSPQFCPSPKVSKK